MRRAALKSARAALGDQCKKVLPHATAVQAAILPNKKTFEFGAENLARACSGGFTSGATAILMKVNSAHPFRRA